MVGSFLWWEWEDIQNARKPMAQMPLRNSYAEGCWSSEEPQGR
jgi:hypothetical protein